MEILCHRGLWGDDVKQNCTAAHSGAWARGWSTEIDVRDRLGGCVVSHDPASYESEDLSDLLSVRGPNMRFALNVKSDGLMPLVSPSLAGIDRDAYFVFDGSVPDQLAWIRAGIPTFTRHSEVEPDPVLYRDAAGVWLDAFYSDWWDSDVIERHLSRGKKVGIVSPELHGRAFQPVWELLVETDVHLLPGVSLCTDHPDQAAEWFGLDNKAGS